MVYNFTWSIAQSCNYRCPYCFQSGTWEAIQKTDKPFSPDKIIKAWKRINAMYGESIICISGGEPTLYPNFIELIKEISKIHRIGISTNLSIDVREIINNLDSSRVALTISFHPYFMKMKDMLDKLNLLRSSNWPIELMVVGWPPLIPSMNVYRTVFKEFKFFILPFWGSYNNKNYPMDYTKEEKYSINRNVAKRDNKEDFKPDPLSIKGRMCRAGQVYAHIDPNGRVLRCSSGGGTQIHNNFYDDNFKLLDNASLCDSEYCRCLEWVVCE